MKCPSWLLAVATAVAPQMVNAAPLRDYPVRPVPFTQVHLIDAFWQPKLEINRTVTIPYIFDKCEQTGRIDNFIRAATALRGEEVVNKKPPGFPFDDTDVYKTIEGASYTLSVQPDPRLEAYIDDLIATIAAAQEPDGYLYTTRTIDPQHPHAWSGRQRWANEQLASHELYDLGHLYESAVAHFQATEKRSLLNIAIKSADLLDKTFGPGKRAIFPGHQVVEMGLCQMYRATGDVRYLNLAKFFLDQRGPNGSRGAGNPYNQSHQKVVDQTEAVGHAVRATYMYSGMADVAALTGDESYVNAIDKIWDNVARHKLYITGGVGAKSKGEAFGPNDDLPNLTAYNETCAAIGNVFWNQRMFLLHADGQYVDVAERTIYNGLISGVSLDGRSFFYPNPLESTGKTSRSPWFDCACCIGNITRFMPSLPGYFYAQKGEAIFVNLFAASTSGITLEDRRSIKITQETRYPWDGRVKLTVSPDAPSKFTINIRIPGWARNQPVAGDLYHFADTSDEPVTLAVNGRTLPVQLSNGYAVLTRDWNPGDVIDLNLPMPIRRVLANDNVSADRGRVALERGPIVYCAEWADNPAELISDLVLPDTAVLTAEFRPQLLGGVTVLTAAGAQPFTAIPYYAWANRGPGEMAVWLRNAQPAAPAGR